MSYIIILLYSVIQSYTGLQCIVPLYCGMVLFICKQYIKPMLYPYMLGMYRLWIIGLIIGLLYGVCYFFLYTIILTHLKVQLSADFKKVVEALYFLGLWVVLGCIYAITFF